MQKAVTAKLHILLVEDSESDAILLKRVLLKAGLDVDLAHVTSAITMQAELLRQPPDIVISDYSLPGFSALGALKVLRERDPDISFVVISGAVGEESAVEIMRAGAADFVIKSALSRLPAVIDRELKETAVRRGRREAEAELQRSQEDLKKALHEAQAANELKTAFLANMSHEIRTPLGAILGYAELASDLVSEPEVESDLSLYVSAIRRNGEQLLGLVGDILDLTKIESNRLEIENVSFDLRREIESVLLSTAPAAAAKNIALASHLDQIDFPILISDPTRVKQILINVIGNAVKFTASGSVTLRVSQTMSDRRICTRFLVQDTGIGLKPEQLQRLFEPFVQGDASTSRKFGGTGLGLSLSRKLARHLGGDLKLLSSNLGAGSTFEITLLADVATVEKQAPQNPSQAAGSLKNYRILLVEDSTDNQLIVQHFVAVTGVSLDIASSGIEALVRAQSTTYDLYLMDMQLPGIDGTQTLIKLREQGVRAPIIALTAHAFKGARETAMQAGFTDYLTKPIDRLQLVESLTHHLAPS